MKIVIYKNVEGGERVEISKVLFDEITKLSKSDWDKLKTNIDFLYSSELKQAEKNVFLNPKTAKEQLKFCPSPILLQSE